MTTTPEETHNTEVEDVADELLWSLTPKSNCGCGGYLDYDDSRTKILETLHHQLQKARKEERAFILQELALRDIPEEDGGYPLYTARQISNYLKSEWRIKSDYSELDQDVGITSEDKKDV